MRPLPVNPFGDRRNKQQLESARVIEQERADLRIEQIWRERVKQNVWRRMDLKVRNAQ